MSLVGYNFYSLTSLSAQFDNDSISFKQTLIPYEQNLNLNYISALSNVADSKVANHSNLLLTPRVCDTDIFNINNVSNKSNFITTTLSVPYSQWPIQSLYLTFSSTDQPVRWLPSTNVAASTPTDINFNNTIFEIELMNELFCRIKHVSNGNRYYLKVDPTTRQFYFSGGIEYTQYPPITTYNGTVANPYKDLFRYILGNSIALSWSDSQYGTVSPYYAVLMSTTDWNLQLSSYQQAGNIDYNTWGVDPTVTNGFFISNDAITDITPKLNTSWVSYDTVNINSGKIVDGQSVYNVKGNNLIHYEYNTGNNTLKVLKLKNNISEKNVGNRASYIYDTNTKTGSIGRTNKPAPFFREYTTIHTGGDSEKSYNDLTLSYVTYDKDYIINPDQLTKIVTPSSLYPFTQINVNDTTFVKNGAFGSPIPQLSDKIFTNDPGDSNGSAPRYLVTWLSAGYVGDFGLWVDRYYYPDLINRRAALSSYDTKVTFQQPI
ncbi:MAG: hypothetical protein EBU90_27645, partial [Proteobacteria bacterium]|nr:hypothetical protein [Pseudomonadota bacterium]